MTDRAFETTPPSPADTLVALGITVESVFVPFSQSRSKDSEYPNLNWRVTIKRNGRDVLTTDYVAGMAHCPGYNKKPHAGFHGSNSIYRRIVTRAECEKGKPVKQVLANDDCMHGKEWIEPSPVDVLYSLFMESDVLDSGGFEGWADNLGYDADSRAAESIYRDCLDLALQMRAGFGSDGMAALQTAFEDY